MLRTVGAGRQAGPLFEQVGKGARGEEARSLRDILQSEIGGGQELLGPIEVHAPDFLMEAAAEVAAEPIFQ